jgi:hypothetical protein
LLISEPERDTVANAIQSLKISAAKRPRKLGAVRSAECAFWQKRYYDRNEWDHKEFIEKLKYSSGADCGAEIESWRNGTYSFPIP